MAADKLAPPRLPCPVKRMDGLCPSPIAQLEAELDGTQAEAVDYMIEETCWSADVPDFIGGKGTAVPRCARLISPIALHPATADFSGSPLTDFIDKVPVHWQNPCYYPRKTEAHSMVTINDRRLSFAMAFGLETHPGT